MLLAAALLPSPTILWSIGTTDRGTSEFALAPDGWKHYREAPTFVVGRSRAEQDWPYVLPGPADDWAGSQTQRATVVFDLEAVPEQETARLVLSFTDTHASAPPTLRIRVNGEESERPLPQGAGDDSINGKPGLGKPHEVTIEVPASHLFVGTNVVEVANEGGSWLLWDALRMEAPIGFRLGQTGEAYTGLVRKLAVRGLVRKDGKLWQPVDLTFRRTGSPATVEVRHPHGTTKATVAAPETTVRILVPEVVEPATVRLELIRDSGPAPVDVNLLPVRKMSLYILNHSHVDIGYTETQEAVMRKQAENLRKAIRLARETASNPPGSRFIWNAEVAWTLECYRQQFGNAEEGELDDAVRKGWVHLEGAYLNLLTGLSHPEELVHMTRYARREASRLGVPLESAMLSDTPGYAWGTVDALAQAGIRYLSVGHNRGYVHLDNQAFWWESKSGEDRVLVWTPFGGYDLCSLIQRIDDSWLSRYQGRLDETNYPYSIGYIRWNGVGDNAAPDLSATEFARRWNAEYVWPKLVVSSTTEAFRAFEKEYGDVIPRMRREFMPLWEDGAGSTALETAMNRSSAERLAQAETLFVLNPNRPYPKEAVHRAWEDVMLFSEHTWGSYLSIKDPEHRQTREQWDGKRRFALEADRRSRELLSQALGEIEGGSAFDVVNTVGWDRSGLVEAPATAVGDRVLDDQGKPVPSQRLADGRLVFLVRDIPAFGRRGYRVVEGSPHEEGEAKAGSTWLENDAIRVVVDPLTGAVSELTRRGDPVSYVDLKAGSGLNEYLYLPGAEKPSGALGRGQTKITVVDSGPLVATLRLDSDAPGARHLTSTLRVVAGLDWLEIENLVDKTRAPATVGSKSYWGAPSKEAVHFSFPFAIPDGRNALDRAFAVLDTASDTMIDSMTNWFTVGRWAMASNQDHSVVLALPDTPLIQAGGITTGFGAPWIRKPATSPHLVAWAMNNYWATNYRAYQEGPTTFRFGVRPAGRPDFDEAARFGWGYAQPLLAASPLPPGQPNRRVVLKGKGATITMLKPAEDGSGRIVRIQGGPVSARVHLQDGDGRPLHMWRSGVGEQKGGSLQNPFVIPANAAWTLRLEP